MKKDLPKMYHNTINKNINNVQNVYSSLNKNDNIRIIREKKNIFEIESKIRDIFNSPNFIYKADVFIVRNGRELKKRIIAKQNNNLITMDNEIIPISEIDDIYK